MRDAMAKGERISQYPYQPRPSARSTSHYDLEWPLVVLGMGMLKATVIRERGSV
jgi:hypothetical protein